MITYTGRTFHRLDDRDSRALFQDLDFENCIFDDSLLSYTEAPELMSTVRNVRLVNCVSVNSSIRPVILEDVVVDGLKTNQLLIVWGALFKHVTLKGKIGPLKFNMVPGMDLSPRVLDPFSRARAAFYEGLDWALDISQANFTVFDMHGIPARLVRRDPETQVVVTRAQAQRPGWRECLSSWNDYWPQIIDMFLDEDVRLRCYGEADMVLVAPKGMRRAKLQPLIDGLNELRRLGVAEPD